MEDPGAVLIGECVLRHRGFAVLEGISFRRSAADNTPVMILPLGGGEAAVPLRSLQRELGIEDDTDDGRMLALIAEALDYVPCLRPGDRLPAEVLTGEASWQPRPSHRVRAMARLHMQMVTWLGVETADTALSSGTFSPERIEHDPALRAALQRAFSHAAEVLKLNGSEAVVALIEQLAEEAAHIEALRDALLARVQAMAARVGVLGTGWRGDARRLDTLGQVNRLAGIAVGAIAARFDDVDAQTGEVIATLRNFEGQRTFIRSNRDWLHRSRLAWDPLLREWSNPPSRLDETAWTLIGTTYQFLAPRYMHVQEWQAVKPARPARRAARFEGAVHW